MIPPVEGRQVRPCFECVALDHEEWRCQAGYGDIPTDRDRLKEDNDVAARMIPCNGHLTPEEYREMMSPTVEPVPEIVDVSPDGSIKVKLQDGTVTTAQRYH